jgi:hypothetical protein
MTLVEFGAAVDAHIRIRTDLPAFTFVDGIWACGPLRSNLFEDEGGVRAESFTADPGMILGYGTGASDVFPLSAEGAAGIALVIGGWIGNHFMWR